MEKYITKKRILFISALDFKKKSIQVIRKTPEAFAENGWDVHYIVARDNSKESNYFYENEFNPTGVVVYRIYFPFSNIITRVRNLIFRTILEKIRIYIVIIKLAFYANKIIKSNKFDVIYGYEAHGALAYYLLKLFRKLTNTKFVSRFQGSFLYDHYQKKKYFKILLGWDTYLPLYLKSDLCIMTNDGTQGDRALKIWNSKNLKNLKFWINGVDEFNISESDRKKFRENLNIYQRFIFLTTCRLESWKKVDRVLKIVNNLVNKYSFNNFCLLIVGDGNMRKQLEQYSNEKNLTKYIKFLGAKNHSEIQFFLSITDVFFSVNNTSNVGNPLLEAMRANKIIFTLNNGDTGLWIKHKKNGFIYDIDDTLFDRMANDIIEILNNTEAKYNILENIKISSQEKLWNWSKRLNEEINTIDALL